MTKKREGIDVQVLRLGTMVGPPLGFSQVKFTETGVSPFHVEL